jgi:carbonic anhydrase
MAGNERFVAGPTAPEARTRAAVAANVRWSMQQLFDTPEGRARAAERQMKLVGAVYDLETGRVRLLA